MPDFQNFSDFFKEAPKVRLTKIVCTLGPASCNRESIGKLMACGLDVARLNFSHGTHGQKMEYIAAVRSASKDCSRCVAILADLQGPKLRVGEMRGGKPVLLKDRELLTITSEPVFGTAERVYVDCPGLAEAVSPGTPILLSDGSITLQVREVRKAEGEIVCEIIHGGELYPRKGVNLPGVKLSISSLTKKDREDLRFAVEQGVDWIALSFVREARDILELRQLVDEIYSGLENPVNSEKPRLLAKIEKPEAIGELEAIVEAADGIMVARGDLGVEMPLALVPIAQKAIIAEANRQGKPVITATQMLESMISAPVATRAEACDVANAVFDGSDAVMLSAETAMGSYPCEAVSFMARVLAESEASLVYEKRRSRMETPKEGNALERSACDLADREGARALVVMTREGDTARRCAACRPMTPILAVCSNEDVGRQLVMRRGITPVYSPLQASEGPVKTAREALEAFSGAREGETFALLAKLGRNPLLALCPCEEK